MIRLSLLLSTLIAVHSFGQKDTTLLEQPALMEGDTVINHLAYSLVYSEKHEQAKWVSYLLTQEELIKVADRSNNFIVDSLISTGSATKADYKGSGYDRGHLAPAGDMSWSEEVMNESFYFSNMSPQVAGFNRGIWKNLEEQVRDWTKEYDSIYVVTGPILHDSLESIGFNRVSIPEQYYKVVLRFMEKQPTAQAFVLNNSTQNVNFLSNPITVDSLESIIKLDLFYSLDDSVEIMMEAELCDSCWSSSKTQHKSDIQNQDIFSTPPLQPSLNQCNGITSSGNRCKRKTKSKSGYCYQHEKK
jgi:endonuclease G